MHLVLWHQRWEVEVLELNAKGSSDPGTQLWRRPPLPCGWKGKGVQSMQEARELCRPRSASGDGGLLVWDMGVSDVS